MSLIDAHCHLANLADVMDIISLMGEASQAGISRYVSSALRRQEVRWHLANPHRSIIFSAGIHPNFDQCDLDLPYLEALCASKSIWAIGEIGLDRKGAELARQESIFRQQLELARKYDLPVVLHLVGHCDLAVKTMKQYNLPYLVHGFAGSVEAMQRLAKLGAAFTISSRILKADKQALLNAMLATNAYLFETDITQYYVKLGETNPLLRLVDVLNRTSVLTGIALNVLLASQEITAKLLGIC